MKSCKFIYLISVIAIITSGCNTFAQDTTQSLAFKNNRPQRRTYLFYQPDLSYQIWQQFNLIKEANAGSASAQHELGLRYLLGEGMKADTVLGAHWIKKAADQKLTAAAFNYGILLINGWGVEWDPFQAFNFFLLAAKDGMPEAQHLIGVLYTDNLIVKRNWNTAYLWIKKASEAGYAPAKKTLENISKKVNLATIDTTISPASIKVDSVYAGGRNNSIASSLGLAFIDFDAISDSTVKADNNTLLGDLALIGDNDINSSIYVYSKDRKDSTVSFDSLDISLVLKFAENGSPEALTLIGKFYEEGLYYKKDKITAAAYYIRAIRMESPRAPSLLYEMIKPENFYNELKNKSYKNDPVAMFVWYGLNNLGFDRSITPADAFNLLSKSASSRYLPAMVEIAGCYYSGKIIKEDKEKALSIWKDAERSGSKEATLRIETAQIFNNNDSSNQKYSFEELSKLTKDGSLLALVSLAYCYETGKGIKMNRAEAVKNYRLAAERGSQYAYKELQQLYDLMRPQDDSFRIN